MMVFTLPLVSPHSGHSIMKKPGWLKVLNNRECVEIVPMLSVVSSSSDVIILSHLIYFKILYAFFDNFKHAYNVF